MTHRQQSVHELFEEALNLRPEQWPSFLDKVGHASPPQRAQLERLLDKHHEAGTFLEQPFAGLPLPKTRILAGRFAPGVLLGERFLITRFISRGGMGEVYEVEDRFLQGVRLALKVILPHIAADPEAQRRFEQEVLLARQIVHPNLCPIYDIFHYSEPPPAFSFLTMKLLPGESLAQRLMLQRPLPAEEAQAIEAQLLAGLAAVHAAGIVHRDIKPNNIMLQGTGKAARLWITDFGLARLYGSDVARLSGGGLAGTPGYLAPELLLGRAPSQASDLFALGTVLHELYTGHKPWLKPGSFSVQPAEALRAAHVPAASARLVRELLADETGRRCRAFAEQQKAPGGGANKPQLWTRRRMLGAGAGVTAVAAASLAWRRQDVDAWLHPLPSRRFVALLLWPATADARLRALLAGMLDAIEQQLSRVEAFDHDFFVMTAPALHELKTAAEMNEAREAVGANLMLTASAVPRGPGLAVVLAVLDPRQRQPLRQTTLETAPGQEHLLPERAVRAAAQMLHVSEHLTRSQIGVSTTRSPQAAAAFQAAEALKKKENDEGLDAAIEAYQRAVELDPHYALAFARLAFAYSRLYEVRGDGGALVLATRNYQTALALMPDLVEAYRAEALVQEQQGDDAAALHTLAAGLALDPRNYKLLLEQAQVYYSMDRWAEAEQAFDRLFKQRPNYWQAYNELGVVYSAQGKYRDALTSFRSAGLGAPKVAVAFANKAAVELILGDTERAIWDCQQSLRLQRNALAAGTYAATLRLQRKAGEALAFAQEAIALDAANPACWLEYGDCLKSLAGRAHEAKRAYERGAAAVEEQLHTIRQDGPGWMLLALLQALAGERAAALSAMRTAQSFPVGDMDSQLCRARILEVAAMREQALEVLRQCFQRGATKYQIQLDPEMEALRADPRYEALVRQSAVSTARAT